MPHGGVRKSDERAVRRTASSSHSIAMALSKVERTSPILPPSAINASAIFAGSLDNHTDVQESRGYWRVRLVDGNADASYRRKTIKDRACHSAGSGLNQL